MKTTAFSFIALNLVLVSASFSIGLPAATADPVSLSPGEFNRLKVDLLGRTSATDFFQQGQRLRERERRLLEQRQRNGDKPILRTNEESYEQMRRRMERDEIIQGK